VPTIEDALAYMGIDYPDDVIRRNATRALSTAIKTLHGAVGEDVEQLLPNDERATEIVLMFTDDLYSQRGTSAKVTGATRQLVSDMIMQLQMELRTLREEAAKA
jgi:hypothetical protein